MAGLRANLRLLVLALPLLAACAAPQASKSPAPAPAPEAVTPPAAVPPHPPSLVARDPMFDGLAKTGANAALVAALRAGGMVNRLRGEGPFTLFAPSDAAFAALPEGELARLMEPENKPELVRLLNAHLVTGALGEGSLVEIMAANAGRLRFATAAGVILTLLPTGKGGYMITDDRGHQAQIMMRDIPMTNGQVHVIDRVLTP